MRYLLTALIASSLTLLWACGSPTGPGGIEVPDGELSMALVSGGGQEVQVTDTLPTDIVVEVTKGGTPLTDQLVDWVVLTDNCGSPFVTTTRTDDTGQTGNRLVAGTRAWTRPDGPDTCQMEVRYALTVADTVQARVDTTVSFLVEPGEWTEEEVGGIRVSGSTPLVIDHLDNYVQDQYGNPALWRVEIDSIAGVQGTEYGTAGAKTITVDTASLAQEVDSAVACVTVRDTLVVPGIVRVATDGSVEFRTQGDPDTTSAYGHIQREACQ